ncbi:MAG: Ribonuclease HII [Elusimicrobia bacterium]|nr:Ribonuclease HII [Elusimicrobiota bacterium]
MEALEGYTFDENWGAKYRISSVLPIIAGVDEAGRGPLAGPVVAAAVVLPWNPKIVGLRDSKIIPPEQREALYCEIQEQALAWEVAIVEPVVIDSINILEATLLAMRQCVQNLSLKPGLVLVDGNQEPGSGFLEKAIVKGDQMSASIMAASILAKVTRDQIMLEAHDLYPHYGFDEHKGYGSAKHFEAIKLHGPCPLHRRSFEPMRSLT